MKSFVLGALVALLLSACASGLSARNRYPLLKTERRRIFLAYYPLLSPDQRRTLLGSDDPGLKLIHKWLKNSPNLLDSKAHWTLTRLEILKPGDGDGTRIPLRAILHYADGRSTEVTADVNWRVTPDSLARMDANTLIVGCVNGELRVSADFYGERRDELSLPIRKSLSALQLSIAPKSEGASDGAFITLRANALCQDGTTSDVSCVADWSTDHAFGTIEGCGELRLYQKKFRHEGPSQIELRYGGLLSSRRLQLIPEGTSGINLAPVLAP